MSKPKKDKVSKKISKIKDYVNDDDKKALGVKERKPRSYNKKKPIFINKLVHACGGQTEAAETLGMSGPGINVIVREDSCRMVVELAAEYVYKTLYAGNLGEEVEETNDKKLKRQAKEMELAKFNLNGAIKYMQENNWIKAYDLIRSAEEHVTEKGEK
jgi:hypothetical protein